MPDFNRRKEWRWWRIGAISWRVAAIFFTVTLRDRRARLLVEHIGELRQAIAQTRTRKPFVR